MNYFKIKNERINLDLVIRYYPEEKRWSDSSERIHHNIVFVTCDGRIFTIGFGEDCAARDIAIMRLDALTESGWPEPISPAQYVASGDVEVKELVRQMKEERGIQEETQQPKPPMIKKEIIKITLPPKPQ